MDVGNIKDPDMPPMSLSTMPMIAPSGDDDEADPSRLLWVPARVHPELDPTEFQSFLQTRVNSIRRRSRDSLASEGEPGRGDSGRSLGASLGTGNSLRRQKSMLSRQIDSTGDQGAAEYVDGAERLERKRSSQGGHARELSLDELVNDPTKAVQKLAQESQGPSDGPESSPDDMPILPMAPGMGLRRSTRTTYRKGGSLRSGDKSRRGLHRQQESQSSETVPPIPEAPPGHSLSRVQSEPISESISRPSRPSRRPQGFVQESPEALAALEGSNSQFGDSSAIPASVDHQDHLSVRSTSTSSNSAPPRNYDTQRPQHESPPTSPPHHTSATQPPDFEPTPESLTAEPPLKSSRRQVSHSTTNQPQQLQQQHVHTQQQQYQQYQQPQQIPPAKSPTSPPSQNLNDRFSSGPSSIPGGNSSRTEDLTFIPTITDDKKFEERKIDKKSKKDRDDDGSSTKSSGSAWKWFKGSTDDKKKDEGKRSKTKALVEKAQDNVRLDVIQTSIDKTTAKGRESFVLDRDAVDSKLQEERKKENNRRSDAKKEKDGSIFSTIFGGGKRKEEKDKYHKKAQHLRVPSEPPAVKPLEPDVDYHWTRFPLLEERAIYRMAHIKLANPRRPLLSQVLLSNFMYSYLAIVQAMHPNMNVPVSPQQKRLEEEARRKREEEEYLAQQQMMADQDDEQALDQYDFDYHRVSISPLLT